MRNQPNDPAIGSATARRSRGAVPERRCILTGEVAPAARLIRLAVGPDGAVAPDVLARAPGRGAWIGVDQSALAAALAKGRLKGALARSLKGAAVTIADDLPDRIAVALRRAVLDRLGLELRAGFLMLGMDRINEAARRGQVHALLHASDAGADGRGALAQAWRVGRDDMGSGQTGTVLPLDRSALSVALGRENAVHLALVDVRAAARVMDLCNRWQFFCGWARDSDDPEPMLRTSG